jgi:hypothetical protein
VEWALEARREDNKEKKPERGREAADAILV